MGFVVSSLPEYIKNNGRDLLVKHIFNAPTAQLINVQTGVKHKEALNFVDDSIVMKERACGWDASGNTTFTQRIVSVGNYEVEKEWCVNDLKEKWLNEETVTSALGEKMPFEEVITEQVMTNLQREIDKLIWNASSGDGDLFDGLLEIIKAEGTAVSTSGLTTVYDKVAAVYDAIPVDQIDVAEIFMGVDDYRTLCREMVAKNLFHYSVDMDPDKLEYVFPGTSTKIHGVSGLNGTHNIVAANPKYLYWATDMVSDSEDARMFYDEKADTFCLRIKFNLGAQVAFPDSIVYA